MASRRNIRRLAMQLLYQIDMRSEADLPAIKQQLTSGPDSAEVAEAAFQLASAAWQSHDQADELFAKLAPKWPTYRQPPVDRAILRLGYYEIVSKYAPVKVAINEAVELAKTFGAEQSPSFINGLLDKVTRQLEKPDRQQAQQTSSNQETQEAKNEQQLCVAEPCTTPLTSDQTQVDQLKISLAKDPVQADTNIDAGIDVETKTDADAGVDVESDASTPADLQADEEAQAGKKLAGKKTWLKDALDLDK